MMKVWVPLLTLGRVQGDADVAVGDVVGHPFVLVPGFDREEGGTGIVRPKLSVMVVLEVVIWFPFLSVINGSLTGPAISKFEPDVVT